MLSSGPVFARKTRAAARCPATVGQLSPATVALSANVPSRAQLDVLPGRFHLHRRHRFAGRWRLAAGRLAAAAALIAAAASLQADPIAVEVSTTSGQMPPTRITGNDMVDVFNRILEREAELKQYVGKDLKVDVTYLGVPVALQLEIAPDGRTARLDIPAVRFSRVFQADSSDQLQTDIEDFVRNEGSAPIADLREVVNRSSTAGITDGNPNATTAILSDAAFDALTLHPDRGMTVVDETRWHFTHQIRGGSWRAADMSGYTVIGDLRADWRVTPRTTLTGFVPVTFTDTQGASTWGGGFGGGVTQRWKGLRPEDRWDARTSLFAGAMLRGSQQLAAGGAIGTYGAAGALSYRVWPRIDVGMLAQISDYAAIPMTYDGFQLDRRVDQHIGRLGARMRAGMWSAGEVEGYVVRSTFLRPAAVGHYDAAGVGFQWSWRNAASVRTGVETTQAERFHAESWQLRVNWGF